jgi:hypothetical protein
MALDNERIEQRSSAARVVLVVQAGADRAQALAGLLRGLPSDAAALALLPPGEIRALRGAFGGLVETARDGLTLRPGLVVAVPADAIVLAHGGRLRVLRDMVDEGGAERIDRLLASLAALPAPRIVFLRLGAASGGGRSALALQEAGGRIVVEGENGDPFARAADLRGPIGTALAATRGYLGAGVAPPFALDAASRDPSMPQRPFGPLGCDARLDALSEALPPLVKAAGARGRPLRIWVQGCDTPELAYAVAVRALEAAAGSHAAPPPEVIVTDSDPARLDRARGREVGLCGAMATRSPESPGTCPPAARLPVPGSGARLPPAQHGRPAVRPTGERRSRHRLGPRHPSVRDRASASRTA